MTSNESTSAPETGKAPKRTVYRFPDGSFTDNGSLLGCRMFWDEYGAYIGQEQLNVIGEGYPDEPLTFFFKAEGNEAGEFGLSHEEMNNAIEWDGAQHVYR